MSSNRIAQTNQQQKSETSQASGILQRTAVRSVVDAGVQLTDDKEALALSNSAFSKDFSRVPISTTRPQQIMAKLMIGPVGDKYEQEADRVAAHVVQRINAPVRSDEDETVQPETMETKEKEARLRRTPILQRKSRDAGMAAAPDLEASINQARGGGKLIADNIREPMEQAFGTDFSGVKVHTDAQSDELNRSIQARAFTTGQDVFFRQGEYNPGSRGGQELLAHELTHVVQQRGENRTPIQRYKISVGPLQHESGTSIKTDMIVPGDTLGGSGVSMWPSWWPMGGAETANDFLQMNFVQGHLLNQGLGGKGNNRVNLTPLTRSANSQMSATIESRAKSYLAQNYAIEYWVGADYSSHPTVAEVGGSNLHPVEQQRLQAVLNKMASQVWAQITVYQKNNQGTWRKWDKKYQPYLLWVKNEGTALRGGY